VGKEREGSRLPYVATLPERSVRAAAAALGGALYETAQVLLPRAVRRSRLYEVTAKNALRIAIELVGGVASPPSWEPGPGTGELAVRKAAGNVVEVGSIVAFGFSPLWLIAAASDVMHGSRVYLDALVDELKRGRILAPAAEIGSVDELLAGLEIASGRAAGLIDIPPVELAELRRSVAELRSDAAGLPTPAELADAFRGLRREADAERASLLEVSAGIGLAFLLSARNLGRRHLLVPYREDWRPLRDEGFAAYARRVAEPYRRAVASHLDPARRTLTERALDRGRRWVSWKT
jgi:hypothetical protein